MRLTNKVIKAMLRNIFDGRTSFEVLFHEQKKLTALFYSNPNKQQCERLRAVSHYLNRKLGQLNEITVSEDNLYQLNDDVEYHTIFGTGGVGRIRKGAIVKILGVYNDHIVVGCNEEALSVPFIACMTPNHPNFTKLTFKEVA